MIILFLKVYTAYIQFLLDHDINRQSQNMMSSQFMNNDYYHMYPSTSMAPPQNGGLPPPYPQSSTGRTSTPLSLSSVFLSDQSDPNKFIMPPLYPCPLIISPQTLPRSPCLRFVESPAHHPAKFIFPPKFQKFAAKIHPQRAPQIAPIGPIRLHRRGVTSPTGSFVRIGWEFHRRNVIPPVLHELFRGNVGTNQALDCAVDMAKPRLFPSQLRAFEVRFWGLFLALARRAALYFLWITAGISAGGGEPRF